MGAVCSDTVSSGRVSVRSALPRLHSGRLARYDSPAPTRAGSSRLRGAPAGNLERAILYISPLVHNGGLSAGGRVGSGFCERSVAVGRCRHCEETTSWRLYQTL